MNAVFDRFAQLIWRITMRRAAPLPPSRRSRHFRQLAYVDAFYGIVSALLSVGSAGLAIRALTLSGAPLTWRIFYCAIGCVTMLACVWLTYSCLLLIRWAWEAARK